MLHRIRRRQFSSCDGCRKARVACDAGSSRVACSRCVKRNRQCSFEWMAVTSTERRNNPSVTPEIASWLRGMYEDVFEAVFGSWLGNYSCPFAFGEHACLEQTNEPLFSVSISSLCRQVDQMMRDLETQGRPMTAAESAKEAQIDETLTQAIHAFSARWLPLTTSQEGPPGLTTGLWRTLRQNLPRTMNRPCYRSMLTLYLFSMVPVPVDIPEDEEETGLPAQVCVQAALQQVQGLRARQRSLEFNGSTVQNQARTAILSADQTRTDFLRLEATIYWAALTFDTSSALTFNTKSILSAGLLGWEREAAWRMVRACTELFHEQTGRWRDGVVVDGPTAERIIAAAQAWKLRVWKVGTVLKEALREGHGEDAVQGAFASVVNALETFNGTYRPLLIACERRLPFLGEVTKLRWYELMLHYHLCILIIVDAIETARRVDLLDRIQVAKSEAEGGLMSCLRFGLINHFTIARGNSESVVVPLVAIDPYPHHVVAGVQLLWKGIERDTTAGELSQSTCRDLQTVLLQTLELLPQTSKSVRKATEQARSGLTV